MGLSCKGCLSAFPLQLQLLPRHPLFPCLSETMNTYSLHALQQILLNQHRNTTAVASDRTPHPARQPAPRYHARLLATSTNACCRSGSPCFLSRRHPKAHSYERSASWRRISTVASQKGCTVGMSTFSSGE